MIFNLPDLCEKLGVFNDRRDAGAGFAVASVYKKWYDVSESEVLKILKGFSD